MEGAQVDRKAERDQRECEFFVLLITEYGRAFNGSDVPYGVAWTPHLAQRLRRALRRGKPIQWGRPEGVFSA